MQRRFYVAMILLALIGALFIATQAHAATGDLTKPKAQYQGLLDLIQNASNQWPAVLRGYATRLFWILAAIQLVWTFFPLVLKQADFGEIVGELVRFILVIGFFYALLLNATTWATAIVDSFRQAGAAASHTGTTLQPGNIFYLAIDLANTVLAGTPGGIMHIPEAFAGVLAAAIILLAFAFIAAFMGLTLIESYVVINASVLFMGFGGAQWTREYAIAMARYAVAVGAKLFVLTLIVGLIVTSANQWQTAYTQDASSMWSLVGLSLVCAYLAKQIPDLVQSLITGTSLGGGGAIGAMAAAGVAAATAAGVAGVSIASGGVSAAGRGLEKLAGDQGGGGSGLAGMIQSSISAAAGPAASGATGDSGSGAALSPRIGGHSTPTPGAGANSHGTPSRISKMKQGAHKAVHTVTASAVRTAGTLAAISVPGMEGAAGLSIGPHTPQPGFGGGTSDQSGDFATSDTGNTIRPATPSSSPDDGNRA